MESIIRGHRLAYELNGTSGDAVAFLNGIGMSMAHWEPICREFSGDFRLLRHDFYGQLLSEKGSGTYSLEEHANDVADLLDKCGLEQAHIVGTSYGSEVGMIFAARFPQRCKSLMIINGTSELDSLLEAVVESWKASALSDPRGFFRNLLPWTYSREYLKNNREMLRKREDVIAGQPREYFTSFAMLCDAFLDIDLTSMLSDIRCPTSILFGEEDILKPLHFSKILEQNIPNATLEILANSAHGAAIENPELIASALKKTLKV